MDRYNQLGIIEIIDDQNLSNYPIINFLPDRDHPQNLAGFKIFSILRTQAQEYNKIFDSLKLTISSVSQFKDQPSFSVHENTNNVMNLSNFVSNSLAICTSKDIWDCIDNYSGMSVQYGIQTPNYPLNKIQSVIVDNFLFNKKKLEEDREKIETINFAGEHSILIFKIPEIIPQVKLNDIDKSTQIETFLISMKRKSVFHKYLANLLGEL